MEKKEETKQPSGSFSEVWDKRGQETDAANDFRKKIEMEITEARPGYAVGEIVLKPWHMNILGIVHGGRRKYRMVMHFRCANARFMMIRRRCWHRRR